MPSEHAMLMSTSSRIAAMPAATCAISRGVGPRTAATMQNSVAPVFAVCFAASTSDGMSSHAERTGESNSPDCEQKWQSSGQPPVFSETIPSTSTSGPHQRIRTVVGQLEQGVEGVVGQLQDLGHLLLGQALARVEHLAAGGVEDRWRDRGDGHGPGSLPSAPQRGPQSVTRDACEVGAAQRSGAVGQGAEQGDAGDGREVAQVLAAPRGRDRRARRRSRLRRRSGRGSGAPRR